MLFKNLPELLKLLAIAVHEFIKSNKLRFSSFLDPNY